MPKSRVKKLSAELYKDAVELMAKASLASQKVLEENKRLGIPTPFAIGKQIYYFMPDGRIVNK